jgi:nitroreductase
MAKRSFLERIGDLTKIHQRANFSKVDNYISKLNFETHFEDLAAARYTCRTYTDRPVQLAKVNKILDVARLAPTAANQQPVHVWALTSPEALARIHQVHDAFGAPVVFMVGSRPEDAWVRSFDGKNAADCDAAIVATHIMLVSFDMGLGGAWIASFDPAKVAELFPETAGYEVSFLLAIGHPAENAEPTARHYQRKSLEEFSTVL